MSVPLSAMGLSSQKIALHNTGSAVGNGCFAAIDLLPDCSPKKSPYTSSIPAIHVRKAKKKPCMHNINAAASTSQNRLNKSQLRKSTSTFSNLTIRACSPIEKRLARKKNALKKTEHKSIESEELLNMRHRELQRMKACSIVQELRPYEGSSLILKSDLSPLEFFDAIDIAHRAVDQFMLAQDYSKAWAYRAFVTRALGDRELHQFVQDLLVQNYTKAYKTLKEVIRHYIQLRKIKTSEHFNRNEFSFHDTQDRQRFYLMRIKPRVLVDTFASTAAINAMRTAYDLTRSAHSVSHVEQACELLLVAVRSYEWLREPTGYLDWIFQRVEQARNDVVAKERPSIDENFLRKIHQQHLNLFSKLDPTPVMVPVTEEPEPIEEVVEQEDPMIQMISPVKLLSSRITARKTRFERARRARERAAEVKSKPLTETLIQSTSSEDMAHEDAMFALFAKSRESLLVQLQADLHRAQIFAKQCSAADGKEETTVEFKIDPNDCIETQIQAIRTLLVG